MKTEDKLVKVKDSKKSKKVIKDKVFSNQENDILKVINAKVSKILIIELYKLLCSYLKRYFENIDFSSIKILEKLNYK